MVHYFSLSILEFSLGNLDLSSILQRVSTLMLHPVMWDMKSHTTVNVIITNIRKQLEIGLRWTVQADKGDI